MSAAVLDIHDFMPATVSPPARHEEPCVVIVLPVVRIERVRDRFLAKWKSGSTDDGLPSDCQ